MVAVVEVLLLGTQLQQVVQLTLEEEAVELKMQIVVLEEVV